MESTEKIEAFLEPESVAIIGASRETGEGGFNIYQNIVESGYEKTVYPVNPKANEILGEKAYPSIKDIPVDVDLAVVSTPREVVVDLVKECAEENVKGVIVITQGFSESDERGKILEKELVEVAEKSGTRILGPNTLGVQNSYLSFSTSFFPYEDVDWDSIEGWRSVSIISQTGLFTGGFPDFRFGKAVDIGNGCDINHVDFLEYFKQDPETKQIFLHIEGLDNGKKFMKIAKDIVDKKPIFALKSGRSKAGADMAASHTGSMSGQDQIYNGIFKQLGIVRIYEIDELKIFARGFSKLPNMTGNKIGVLTDAGAAGVMSADWIEEFGLELAELSKETIEKIESPAPDWMKVENPVDIWPIMMLGKGEMHEVFHTALREMLGDDSISALMLAFPSYEKFRVSGGPLCKCVSSLKSLTSKFEKPVAVWLHNDGEKSKLRRELMTGKNLAVFDNLRNAAKTLAVLEGRKFNIG